MDHNLVRITSLAKVGDSDTSSNFYINFENHKATHGISKIIVKAIDIPNVFYNIDNKGYNVDNLGNNVYAYRDFQNNIQTITLPIGQYTIEELLTALNNLMAIPSKHTLSLNPTTKKVEILTTDGDFQVLGRGDGNTMINVLGFTPTSGLVSQYLAPNFPDLSGISEVYILSNQLGQSNLLTSDAITIPLLAHVPLTVPFGGIEHYISHHPEIDDIVYPNYEHGVSVRKVQIIIVDGYNNILDLGGLDVNIILKVYHLL